MWNFWILFSFLQRQTEERVEVKYVSVPARNFYGLFEPQKTSRAAQEEETFPPINWKKYFQHLRVLNNKKNSSKPESIQHTRWRSIILIRIALALSRYRSAHEFQMKNSEMYDSLMLKRARSKSFYDRNVNMVLETRKIMRNIEQH